MRKKPTSPKKHRGLRRKRRADWDQSREDMERREKLADQAADGFLLGLLDEKQEERDKWLAKQNSEKSAEPLKEQ